MILGIDVGGTHTDSVLVENYRIKKKVKVNTDSANIMSSLLAAAQETVSGEKVINIKRIVLSTTISTNAIVQGKTDRVGMVLQNGPGLSPESLTSDKDAFFVSGYINNRGVSIQPINEKEIKDIGEYFRRENINQIGIAGKFSPRNALQEIKIAEILKDDARNFSLGHRLSGQLNFPRRAATTYLNAAVYNIYRKFIEEVQKFLQEINIKTPVYILKADGGTILIEQSILYPALTIHSGPAASIMGVLATADMKEDAVALDIGGSIRSNNWPAKNIDPGSVYKIHRHRRRQRRPDKERRNFRRSRPGRPGGGFGRSSPHSHGRHDRAWTGFTGQQAKSYRCR